MSQKKISKGHPNRGAHNWLLYNINDSFLARYIEYVRGDVYDLGCGEAPYRAFFLKSADRYVGVDWTQSFHKILVDVTADLNQPLPIETGVAGAVVSLSVMEHLCEPQIMLNEAWRILKPGGWILVQVPWQWHLHEVPHDYFRFTPFGLRYMFNKAGFINISITPQSGVFTMLVMKVNYTLARLIRGPRPMQLILRVVMSPIWYLGQILAPILDRLDPTWQNEATGYFAVGQKPCQ